MRRQPLILHVPSPVSYPTRGTCTYELGASKPSKSKPPAARMPIPAPKSKSTSCQGVNRSTGTVTPWRTGAPLLGVAFVVRVAACDRDIYVHPVHVLHPEHARHSRDDLFCPKSHSVYRTRPTLWPVLMTSFCNQ